MHATDRTPPARSIAAMAPSTSPHAPANASINARGPSAGPLPSRPAIPLGDRPMHTWDEGLT